MSKCFIEGMGGGAGKLFAAIGVTYPEGSTLTCTDGTKTLKAKTTTGQWVFSIPYTGTWTVTATDGTETVSKAVEITTEGQSVSVHLAYRTEGYLYNAGVFDENYERVELTKNSSIAYNESNIYIACSGGSIAYGFVVFKDVKIDGQSKIAVNHNGNSANGSNTGTTIAVVEDASTWTPTGSAGTVAYLYDSTKSSTGVAEDVLLDISSIAPGTYDVAIGVSTQGSSWTDARRFYFNSIKIN